MKKCKRCGIKKPSAEFYRHKGTLDGLGSWCKKCLIKSSVKRQRDNPEKARATQKRWRRANPEKCRAKCRKFRKENLEKVRGYNKSWRDANPDKIFSKQLRRHGITVEGYRRLLALQKGGCAVCGNPCKSGKRLAVDHCHLTKQVRGLLCRDCNTSLGKFHDSPVLLHKAAIYLENAVNKNKQTETNNQ